jgi:hypothetical protein
MRVLAFSLYLVSSASLKVCESESPPASGAASAAVSAEAVGATSSKLALSAPRIGGTQIAVGEHSVELLLHASGLAEAIVMDASGKVVSNGVQLSLMADARGGEKAEAKLAFSAPRGRFEGRCQAKGKGSVELVPGPIDLTLEVGGKVMTSKFSDAVLIHGPRLGGNVLVAGGYGIELFARPSGEVLAFVRDRKGVEVNGDAGLDLRAKVKAKVDSEDIALRFDGARGCFAGRAKAGAELTGGPLELSLRAQGIAAIGGLSRLALLAEASHGGELVLLDGFSAEILVKGRDISVFVLDAAGKASADANLDVKLAFGADASEVLALRWDIGCLCYRGSLAANLDVSLQPLTVSLVAGGQAFVGAAASLRALGDARLRIQGKASAGATLDARAGAVGDAKLNADLKAKAADIKADLGAIGAKAGAGVKVGVEAPKVQVQTPKVSVKQSASAGAQTGGKAKASAGFQIGTK